MDRNLYQQCGGAHVFRRMVMSNYRFVCMYLPLCVRIPVCVTIFPTSFFTVCIRVHMRVPSSLEYQVWSICSVSRVLHRECGIKGEAIEIRATSAKIPQNKSRINGSVRFPNSKSILSHGSLDVKRIPFLHPALTMQHPARFSLYVFVYICVGGSFLRVYS